MTPFGSRRRSLPTWTKHYLFVIPVIIVGKPAIQVN